MRPPFSRGTRGAGGTNSGTYFSGNRGQDSGDQDRSKSFDSSESGATSTSPHRRHTGANFQTPFAGPRTGIQSVPAIRQSVAASLANHSVPEPYLAPFQRRGA